MGYRGPGFLARLPLHCLRQVDSRCCERNVDFSPEQEKGDQKRCSGSGPFGVCRFRIRGNKNSVFHAHALGTFGGPFSVRIVRNKLKHWPR